MLNVLIALLAAPTAPTALQPTGPWTLQEHDTGCQVTRPYGGETEAELGFQTIVTGTGTTLMVTEPKKLLPEGIGSIRLAAAPGWAGEIHYGAFDTSSSKTRMLKLFPDKPAIGSMSVAETLEIGTQPIRFRARKSARH